MPLIIKGDNECPICLENCSFPEQIELFECGHGTCRECYEKMMKRPPFKCPSCRREKAYEGDYRQNWGWNSNPTPLPPMNTVREFINVYKEEYGIEFIKIAFKTHPFMTQIDRINSEYEKRRKKEAERKEAQRKEENAKEKAKANANAICHCGVRCNSVSQLAKHKAAKNH